MLLVLNKTDQASADTCLTWMQDVFALQAAIHEEDERGCNGGVNYMSTLVHSMGLVLEEFYSTIPVCALSAFTGDGVDSFFKGMKDAVLQYQAEYLPEMERRAEAFKKNASVAQESNLARLLHDMKVGQSKEGEDEEEEEQEEEEQE